MINKVRDAVREITPGTSVEVLLERLGAPDERKRSLQGFIPKATQESVEDLQSFVTFREPEADETWSYVNPYRQTITHFFAIQDGKVSGSWEVRK
ncbi:MAG: hypothetical protein A3F78_10290 [Burkholderiales bacterium RIFCSPLOWO2_12_FULL_61_40]|nr:MAG: hypothetical protein A3F78_10290 [Burkholderiales bacterium RIFCSPLOWO2_12_FULL_61_40]